MLLGQNAGCERVRIVGLKHGDCTLQHDESMVEVLIDKVHGAACYFDAIIKSLRLRLEAGKGGKQRRMNVEDAIGKGGNKARREQTHIACEADQVHAILMQTGCDRSIVLGTLAALGNENLRR